MSRRQLQVCPSMSTQAVYFAPISALGRFTFLDLVFEKFFFPLRLELGQFSLLSALICPAMRADFSLNTGKRMNHFYCPTRTVSLSAVFSSQLLMPDPAHCRRWGQYGHLRHNENSTMALVCY